ncbi:hypothetical protein Tco_0522659 [Tanacetum coccineum]
MYIKGDVSTIRHIDFIRMTVIGLSKLLKGYCMFPIKGIKNGNVIDLYLEHHVSDLSHWVQTDIGFDEVLNFDDMEDITGHGVNDFNSTGGDFSGGGAKEIDINDENLDQKYKFLAGVVYPKFNQSLPWNELKPKVGLSFEHPEHLKDCLNNYCVANGYQL